MSAAAVPRFAVGVPNIRDHADPRAIVALARLAEQSGWDGLFVWDQIADEDPAVPATDPWVSIAAAAASTETLRLGVMVTPLSRRRPWKVAREAVAMDMLSEGRFALGVGLGADVQAEFAAFGEETAPRTRADRLDEGLEIITGLWSGEPVSFHGEHFSVDARFTPVPSRPGGIPIWVAGAWPNRRPFRRAARYDGVFPIRAGQEITESIAPEDVAEIVAYVGEHRTRPEPFDVIVEGITEGRDRAADGELVARYRDAGVTWWIEKCGWFRGDRETVSSRVAAGPPPVA